MKRILFCIVIALTMTTTASAAENLKATIHADKAGAKINREIY